MQSGSSPSTHITTVNLSTSLDLKSFGYIFIVDDLDCFNYDYQREASTIKDSCNSILYYSSKVGLNHKHSKKG